MPGQCQGGSLWHTLEDDDIGAAGARVHGCTARDLHPYAQVRAGCPGPELERIHLMKFGHDYVALLVALEKSLLV